LLDLKGQGRALVQLKAGEATVVPTKTSADQWRLIDGG
jgi:hypothetical protein